MLTVDDYGAIRRARRDGMSIRQISRQFGHTRKTVRHALDHAEPPAPWPRNRKAPVLGPVEPEGRQRTDRHAAASHGGFVTFVGHDKEGTAYLTMGGGCHGCSMSKMTMLDGVQTMIVEKIPAIQHVRDLTDHSSGENPFYH